MFISFCAVALCLETSVILHRPFHTPAFYSFIFFATLFAYNVYYFNSTTFSYHRFFAVSGFIGLLPSLYFMEGVSWFYIGVSSAFFGLYLLPVFWPFKKPELYTFQKLFILVLVWVLITFMLPAGKVELNNTNTLLLLYRLVLLTHLCALFYIKDEKNARFRQTAINSFYLLGMLQLLLCIFIGLDGNAVLSWIYLFITILTIRTSFYFNHIKKTDAYYLLFVDGIMLLQSIFVLIKFFAHHES